MTEHLVRFSLLILICSNILFGQIHPDSKIDSLLRIGIENIILHNYSKADTIFIRLDSEYPQNPLGSIYLAANEITKSVDFGEEVMESEVDSLLDSAMEKAEFLLDQDEDNIWHNYYESLIHGYKAYFYAITGNLISAFADGVLSLRSFQKCLEQDQEFSEAYIALGSYNYWKTAQSTAFLWLPFVSDKREEGISLLEKSIYSNAYNRHLGAYSLIWIYIDYNQSEKAVELAEKMISEYQSSRFFKWSLARAYQDIDKKKSIEIFYEILNSYETLASSNQFNEVVLLHKIAMLFAELEDYENALKHCDEILDFDIKSVEIRERLKDRIERTEELKASIIDLMDSKE